MNSALKVGTIFGVPVRIHSSWLLIFGLVTLSLATAVLPQSYPGLGAPIYWALGILTSLLFFGSVLLHEVMHSVVAKRAGLQVQGITLFVFGGVSEIGGEPPSAPAEFLIAAAGPATSLVLAMAFGVLRLAIPINSWALAPISYLALINLSLALFNLIPGFPLDGGRVLRSLIWALGGSFRKATRWAAGIGQFVALLFIAFGIWQVFLGDWINGLWIAFIGWFLNNAADTSWRQVQLQDMLSGVKVRDVMAPQCTRVPANTSLDQLSSDYALGAGCRCLYVADGEQLQGLVTPHNVRLVPREEWGATTANQIMTNIDAVVQVRPEDDLWNTLQKMQDANVNQLPVLENGNLVGAVTRECLLDFLRRRGNVNV